jgi:MFS family permease
MWVLGLAVMIDNVDQYIVRGTSTQIEKAFHVGDFQIGILFSAFIVVNGLATMPASYLGDRWNRTRIMAVTIAAWSLVSALGGLVPVGASPTPRVRACWPTSTASSAAARPTPCSSASSTWASGWGWPSARSS